MSVYLEETLDIIFRSNDGDLLVKGVVPAVLLTLSMDILVLSEPSR